MLFTSTVLCTVCKVDPADERRPKLYPRTYLKEWERHPELARNTAYLIN